MRPLGLLGGTFDPIHVGHLRLALEVQEHLGLECVRLIPAPSPRLRDTPWVEPQTRLRMVQQAVDGIPGLEADGRELVATGPTRTVDTLAELREEYPERSLCWILGADAASRLDQWHAWERLVTLANLIIARRPGAALPASGPVADLIAKRQAVAATALVESHAGVIHVCDIPGLDVSASGIRARLAAGRSIDFLVPERVKHMLLSEGLYVH